MTGLKRFAAFAAVVVAHFACASQASADPPRTLEATLSYQMLQIESTVRPVSRAKFDLLRRALERARNAAAAQHTRPDTRREAIEVLDAIQIVFAQHNFIQPSLREDWKDTIGDALTPLRLSREERRQILSPGEVNGFRGRYVDPDEPLYYVDDDIGSQLIMSVGQRMGWDIRLVWVDDHYFVRWYLTPTLAVNWDWTAGGPTRNEDYSTTEGAYYRDWPGRQRYLKGLTQTYARAQFLYLLARHVEGTAKRRVLELAMGAEPTHEQVQNSLAWHYATEPGLGRGYGRYAVQYALSAWAATPNDPAVADTVACAYAAAGERSLAVEVERFAIARLREARRDRRAIADYESRLRQIQAGRRCSATPALITPPSVSAQPASQQALSEPPPVLVQDPAMPPAQLPPPSQTAPLSTEQGFPISTMPTVQPMAVRPLEPPVAAEPPPATAPTEGPPLPGTGRPSRE